MPIRINLLAEAQAAEEDRRKDPVKRGIFVAAFFVSLVIVWAAFLQVKMMGARGRLSGLEVKWKSMESTYRVAVDTQKRAMEVDQRLGALSQLTTNRFLWGNVLNAFQQTLAGIDDVQVVRFKGEQLYVQIDGTPNRTNGLAVIPGRPAMATERIKLSIDALDVSSPQPGKRVNQFKESIVKVPFFQETLEKTNGVRLTQRSPPQSGGVGGQQFVMFSLECNFPEKTR
jgi:hypothetical protein